MLTKRIAILFDKALAKTNLSSVQSPIEQINIAETLNDTIFHKRASAITKQDDCRERKPHNN